MHPFLSLHLQKTQSDRTILSPNHSIPSCLTSTQHHHYTEAPIANTTVDDHGAGKKVRGSQDDQGGEKCEPILKRLLWKTLFFFILLQQPLLKHANILLEQPFQKHANINPERLFQKTLFFFILLEQPFKSMISYFQNSLFQNYASMLP